MILDVYLYDELVGFLYTDKKYGLSFKYREGNKKAISISMPVSDGEYRKKIVEPFFSGLLPDGDIRDQLARNIQVSPNSIIRLLEHYGREIAGAMVIIDHDENYVSEPYSYREISEEAIAQKIRGADSENLLIWGNDIRLSLAGAQNKMPLYHSDGKWFLPCGNSPSNCIVKPGKTIAVNEFIVTGLARECGFNVPQIELVNFEDQTAFVSYRFDRTVVDGRLTRLHQEDMCQALAIPPDKKYENEGGPGISAIINLLSDYSVSPITDIREFLKVVVFNYIVGNCDSHGKNYSFIYDIEGRTKLAPFYDLVCTTIYPGISRELSMKIGKTKNIDLLCKDDFYKIAGTTKNAMEMITEEVVKLYEKAIEKMKNNVELSSECCEMFERIYADSLPRLERLGV